MWLYVHVSRGGGGVTRLCHFDRNSRRGGVIRGDALAR